MKPLLPKPIRVRQKASERAKVRAIQRIYDANDLATKRHGDDACVRILVTFTASVTLDFFEARPVSDEGMREILAENVLPMIGHSMNIQTELQPTGTAVRMLAGLIDSYECYEAGKA